MLRSLAKAPTTAEIRSLRPRVRVLPALHRPDRRYSDLHTHRVLKRYLWDKGDKSGHLGKKIIKIANHVSETERTAIDAERASVDQKICEYYAERIGERYPVTISGFSSVALYVRLENTAEGSILYREMDDYYHFDELFFKAVTDNGRELNLGDELIAELVRVDLQRPLHRLCALRLRTENRGVKIPAQGQADPPLKRGSKPQDRRNKRSKSPVGHRKGRNVVNAHRDSKSRLQNQPLRSSKSRPTFHGGGL